MDRFVPIITQGKANVLGKDVADFGKFSEKSVKTAWKMIE